MANKKFIIRNQTAAGDWDVLYPQTIAEQVITNDAAKFVTTAQITAWDAKATAASVTAAIATAKTHADTKATAADIATSLTAAKAYADTKATGSGADITAAIATAKSYADTKVAALVDGAPEALDTLKELALALTAHNTEYDALLTVVGSKATIVDLNAHINNKTNPHAVTKAQVGLANVDNTTDLLKPISTATQTALNAKAATADLTAHTANVANPHAVTKVQVGLGNVDNTTDLLKPISTATQTALNAKTTEAFVTAAIKKVPTVTVGGTTPVAPNPGDFWYEIVV